MPDMQTARRPRTVERRVQHLFVQHRAVQLDFKGNEVEVLLTAQRGELSTFTLSEAARLDSLGALAPDGHTVEMIRADIDRTYQAYLSQRRQMPDDGASF